MLPRLMVIAIVLAISGQAGAHSWYPKDCCHDEDCAPVVKIEYLKDGYMRVTTENGRSALFHRLLPKRPSKDNRVHACIYAGEPMCLFVPPGM